MDRPKCHGVLVYQPSQVQYWCAACHLAWSALELSIRAKAK